MDKVNVNEYVFNKQKSMCDAVWARINARSCYTITFYMMSRLE